MEAAAPTVRNLAQTLLTLEANQNEHYTGEVYVFLGVYAKLRLHLSRLVGVVGFHALVSRALALAKAEAPWLEAVRVHADATLEGFQRGGAAAARRSRRGGKHGAVGAVARTAYHLYRRSPDAAPCADIWPEAQEDTCLISGAEETPA